MQIQGLSKPESGRTGTLVSVLLSVRGATEWAYIK